MSASSFGDSMEWGRGRSAGSRKGKRAGDSSSDKPKQPQRGLGVAQLEKIRLQTEMAGYLHHPLGQPPPIHRAAGSINMEDARSSSSLPSSPSSSFHGNISVSSSYPIHPNLVMAYGGRSSSGEFRYGDFQPTNPIIRPPPNYEAMYGAASATHYHHQPSNGATLPLFEPEESIFFRRHHDINRSVDSSNADDPEDVDLELKL